MPETISKEIAETKASQGERELLDLLLNPEVQESLTTLVKELPKLTELVSMLSTIQSLATDEVLKSDTVGAISEVMEPVKKSVKQMAVNVMDAKEMAEESTEVIGIFGLLKMLKDPQAQKLFRFVDAYLKIAAERKI